MKNFGLKFACWLTGFDFEVVRAYDGISKRKISVYGVCMSIPTALWGLNGYFLVTMILDGKPLTGVFVALALGTLIFWVERLVIQATGGRLLFVLRLLIACSSAILGSVIVKTLIFQKDIDQVLAVRRENLAKSMRVGISRPYRADTLEAKQNIRDYHAKWVEYSNKASEEAIGGFSKVYGPGPLTRHFIAQRNYFKKLLDDEKDRLDNVNATIEGKLSAKLAYEKAHEEGLMLKIEAFVYLLRSWIGLVVFLLFFIPLVCLEMITLVVKWSSPVSNFEYDEMRVAQAIRSRGGKSNRDPGDFSTGIAPA